jgi:hypothetical protein
MLLITPLKLAFVILVLLLIFLGQLTNTLTSVNGQCKSLAVNNSCHDFSGILKAALKIKVDQLVSPCFTFDWALSTY